MPPGHGPGLSTITALLRSVLDNADWQSLGEALHPDVSWGPPRPGTLGCRGRSRVLSRCARLHARLSRVMVEETFMYPGVVVLGLWLHGSESVSDPGHLVYQVFDVVDGLIIRITGYTDRGQALNAAYDDASVRS
ncbi:hypothetical protein [Streptomyces mexicanus]|uniref:hypothetical protein n=1 Tax=Streptomyces mexicanus TaxID=178566 RepID=UPI0031EF95DA